MDAISARVDGEASGFDDEVLDEHLGTCARCREFEASATAMHQLARVRPTDEVPDLSRAVVARAAIADRDAASWIARWLLGVVAIQIVVLALPDLFASGDDAHAARHLGAFSLAYAVGLAVVVVRPARARTMLHVALVLAAAILVTALVDVAQGRVPLVNEVLHIPELFSVWFLWLLARPRVSDPDAGGSDGTPHRSVVPPGRGR